MYKSNKIKPNRYITATKFNQIQHKNLTKSDGILTRLGERDREHGERARGLGERERPHKRGIVDSENQISEGVMGISGEGCWGK